MKIKKSNIVIISFLVIFIVSVIWLCVWMKNNTEQQNTNPDINTDRYLPIGIY